MNDIRNELLFEKFKNQKLEKINIKKRISKSKTLSELFDTDLACKIKSFSNILRPLEEEKILRYKTKIEKLEKKIENTTFNNEEFLIQNLLQGLIIKEINSDFSHSL